MAVGRVVRCRKSEYPSLCCGIPPMIFENHPRPPALGVWAAFFQQCQLSLLRLNLAHFSPFFPVFCACSPSRQDGSNEPQAEIQGQETAGKGSKGGQHSSKRASNLRAGQVLHRVENRLRVRGLEGRNDFIEYRRESLAPLPSQFEMMN